MKIYLTLAGVLIFVAIFAEYLTPFDPYVQDLEGALTPPNSVNLLGTDRYGRDVLSRVIMGSQTTLCASLLLLSVISIFGSFIGAICGYIGGKLDTVLMRDYPLIQAYVIWMAIIYVFVNLTADLLYKFLDPRIRD